MTSEAVKAASEALRNAIEDGALVKIGDLVINEETGEIIEWPGGAGDQLEGLVMRCTQAKANEEGWKQAQGVLKAAIGRLLTDRGAKSLSTQYGTASWRGKTDVRMALPDLAAWAERTEAGRVFILAALTLLGRVQVSREVETALVEIGLPVSELMERSIGAPYVHIDRPRNAPPEIERS